MRITIEIDSLQEVKKILAILKELNIQTYNIVGKGEESHLATISKGDKSIDPSALFGIWKDNPRSLDEIRKRGWERNRD